MRHRASTFLSAIAIACVATNAGAQACCVGAGAVTPTRLAMHEDVLVGMTLRMAQAYGSFTSTGTWLGVPSRASEHDFEQDLFVAMRIARRVQLSVLVPLVETRREIAGTTELGGGLGDVVVAGRWDATSARSGHWTPGVAILAGVVAPTGRPADLSAQPMATDSTGLGAAQGIAGVALEELSGPWLFDLIGTVTMRTPRSVHGIESVLAPQWNTTLATTYSFRSGVALSLALAYVAETDGWIGGVHVPNSGRRDPQVALSALVPFLDRWRLLLSAALHPPILGQNSVATFGASTTLTRVWW